MSKFTSACIAAAVLLTGCATASRDITTTFVSPAQYYGHDCLQLAGEMQRLQSRVSQVGGRLDQAASNDAALVTAGTLLFWPALFFVGGTKQQEAEYARLKGEYDAVQQAAVMRKCDGAIPLTKTGTPALTPTTARVN